MHTILNKTNIEQSFNQYKVKALNEKRINEKAHTLKVMEFAKIHFLSPYREGGYWQNAKRLIKGTLFVVPRYNHGLAHSLRQGALAKDIFKNLIIMKKEYQKLDLPELEEIATWALQKDQNFIFKMELASSFQRSGRQSECSSSGNIERYKRYERQDALNFRIAALSSGLFNNIEEIQIFEEAILWSNKGVLDENMISDLKFLRRILHCAHTFDLRRIPSFNSLRICRDGMEQLLGKSIIKTPHCYLLEEKLWKKSGEYLKATGDRDILERSSLSDCFFYQTAHPMTLVDAIYKVNE